MAQVTVGVRANCPIVDMATVRNGLDMQKAPIDILINFAIEKVLRNS